MKEELFVSGRNIPNIDPYLNIWHWQIPLYLFLGGLAAGILSRLGTRQDLGKMKGITVWQDFHKLVVHAEPRAPFQADGELLGSTGGLEVTPVPAGLLVLTPSG